ncbi:hypothetical protein BX661DRAFT_53691 [Kickxella alabastrina]|uniref:uncharacterized protein n=1 Tax=Kickxella alabastrina TaxID=61397 RepID=UPI0022203F05|nr:uncharacterized protein BX661DRAFT_53691 [Kickxella alabastrina]KAI7823999.1 hypothetical protein BX661DRAFT_53691 [Kickxella alabastrina]
MGATALEPSPPNGRRVSAAAGSLADWSMDAVPGLEEFRSMLCGARVVVRLPASGLSRQDSVEAARLVEAIEGYLCSVGCSVDRLPAFALTNGLVGGAVAATAGCETSMQMLSRRPPAYIIINGDMDALRAEFQVLRGILTFSSASAAAASGSRLGGSSPMAAAAETQRRRTATTSYVSAAAAASISAAGSAGGGFSATLGIIVLCSIAAVAEYRECVRILSLQPHSLPPPVVRIVPMPLSEFRLLSGLHSAWASRRQQQYYQYHQEQQQQQQQVGGCRHHQAASFYHGTRTFPTQQQMQQQMQVQGAGGYGVDSAVVGGLGRDVSTPTSSNSDGLYANVWTVDDAPRVVSADTSFTTTVSARSAGDTLAAAAATAAAATDGKKRRKNRPGVLNITSLGGLPPRMEIVEDSQTGPAEMEVAVEGLPGSPPSPLIHVNRELAKSLGCASSPREPLVTAPPLPPPLHTYHIVDAGLRRHMVGLSVVLRLSP